MPEAAAFTSDRSRWTVVLRGPRTQRRGAGPAGRSSVGSNAPHPGRYESSSGAEAVSVVAEAMTGPAVTGPR